MDFKVILSSMSSLRFNGVWKNINLALLSSVIVITLVHYANPLSRHLQESVECRDGQLSTPDTEVSGKTKPVIRLKELPDRVIVDWDECFLEGEVSAVDGVKSLTVNDILLSTRVS
ncbi:MAG: hypothetical protein ACMUIA_03255, partial [bacterium]